MQVVPGSGVAHTGIQCGNQRVYYGNYEILLGDLIDLTFRGQVSPLGKAFSFSR
jgi:hypothetical protein